MRTLRRRWQPIVRSDRPFRHPATLYLDRRGVVALVTALLLPVLLGAIGLGVEASAWTYQTVQLQRAADLAALAAAKLLSNGSTTFVAATAALNVAELNGVSAATRTWNSGSNTLSDSHATAQLVSGIRSSSDQAFKVTVHRSITPMLVAPFLSTSRLTLSATSWAELVQVAANTPQPCVFGLAKESSPGTVLGVSLSGGSGLNTGGCAVRANADVQVVGSGTSTTAAIYSGGTISVGGGSRVQASGGASANLYANNDIDIGYSFGGGSNGSGVLTGNAYAAGNINANGGSSISGVAAAGGSITNTSSTMSGTTTAVGNITTSGSNAQIKANTSAGGNITMNAGAITGTVAASGTLAVNNGATISGATNAGAVTVNVGTITGAVNTSGAMAINNGSHVNGNVDAASIAISNGYISGNTTSTTKATYPGWENNAISGTQSIGSAASDPSAPISPGSPGTIGDPYASNAAVTSALGNLGGSSPGGAINVQWNAAPVVLQPGTYSSITTNFWTNFGSTSAVTLSPGTYYVNGDVNLSGYVAGSGVTIVASGKVQIAAGTVALSAPLAQATSGIPGMLLIGKTSSAFTLISSGNTASLAGVIYCPNAPLTITGGVTATSANCLELIAYTITITGGSTVGGACQSFGATSFSATPALTTVALVQ